MTLSSNESLSISIITRPLHLVVRVFRWELPYFNGIVTVWQGSPMLRTRFRNSYTNISTFSYIFPAFYPNYISKHLPYSSEPLSYTFMPWKANAFILLNIYRVSIHNNYLWQFDKSLKFDVQLIKIIIECFKTTSLWVPIEKFQHILWVLIKLYSFLHNEQYIWINWVARRSRTHKTAYYLKHFWIL